MFTPKGKPFVPVFAVKFSIHAIENGGGMWISLSWALHTLTRPAVASEEYLVFNITMIVTIIVITTMTFKP